MMTRISTVLFFLVAALFVIGPSAAISAPKVVSPGAFEDDFEAEVAANGKNLLLATIGLNKKEKFQSQVLSYKGGKWKQLGKKFSTESGFSTHLVIRKASGRKPAEPCYSDVTPARKVRIQCFKNGRWKPLSMPEEFRDMTVQNLVADGRDITAVLYEWKPKSNGEVTTATTVAKLKGQRLVKTGWPLRTPGQNWPSLVERTTNTKSKKIEIVMRSAVTGERWIESLGKLDWRSSEHLTGVVWGSWGSTSVRAGSDIFSAVNQDFGDIDSELAGTGSTSVYRLKGSDWSEVGGAPVSNDTGYPQGGVFPVGDRVWTIWEEHNGNGIAQGGGLFTKVFAARVSKDGTKFDKELKLWNGRTYFPGPYQAIEYRGGPVFVYMRQFKPNGGLHATLDFSQIHR